MTIREAPRASAMAAVVKARKTSMTTTVPRARTGAVDQTLEAHVHDRRPPPVPTRIVTHGFEVRNNSVYL